MDVPGRDDPGDHLIEVARAGDVVRDSWHRSLARLREPDAAAAEFVLDATDLSAYRDAHPLAGVMPVVRRLLVEPCTDSGIIIAVGDARGRLLWVEGEPGARRRAERIAFAYANDLWTARPDGTGVARSGGTGGVRTHFAGLGEVAGNVANRRIVLRDRNPQRLGRSLFVAHAFRLVRGRALRNGACARSRMRFARVFYRTCENV